MLERIPIYRNMPRSAKAFGAIALTIVAMDTGVRLHNDPNNFPLDSVVGSKVGITDIANAADPSAWLAAGITAGIKLDEQKLDEVQEQNRARTH
jgi:hypothetical protein